MTVANELFVSISSDSLSFPLSVDTLKSIKNIVVGNPRAKVKVLGDTGLLEALVDICRPSADEDPHARSARIESTVILGSLAHAEPPLATLQALLSTSVITHLVLALQQASVQPAPSSAASRALVQKDLETTLKTLANLVKLIGEFCDKGRWGTGIDAPRGKAAKRPTRAEVREEQTARELVGRKIGEMLEPPLLALLISLIPALPTPSTPDSPSGRQPLATSILSPGQTSAILPTVLALLTSLIHTRAHRQAFLAATPSKAEPFSHPPLARYGSSPTNRYPSSISKGKQRATSFSFALTGTRTNDVLSKIVALLRTGAGDAKVKRSALSLLAALAKEEWVGLELRGMLEPDGRSVIDHLGELSNSRDIAVQVAAVEVLATVYRSTRSHASSSEDHLDDWLPMMEDLSRLLGESGEERIRAAFIMAYLIADDLPLQTAAAESDVVRRLEYILEESSGDGSSRENDDEDMDLGEEDLDGKARLREGALLLLSTLTLHLPHLRSHLLTILPNLLPTILLNSLSHPTSSGVRAAAAQLARGLSRSVCVLRSSLVDATGVVDRLIDMVLDVEGRERDEVKSGVVAVLGNLGLEFAPMKQTLIERGVLEVLAGFCDVDTMDDLRLNAIWALKNTAYRSPRTVKMQLVSAITYPRLFDLLSFSSSTEIQSQALALLRNLLADSTESEVEDLITSGFTKNRFENLLEEKTGLLRTGLGAGEEEVVYQTIYVLACVVAGSENLRRWVVGNEILIGALKAAITAPSMQIRTAACIACLNLVDDPSPFRRGQALEQLRLSGIQEAVFLYPTDLLGSAHQADEDSSAELWAVRSKLMEYLRS